MKKLFAIMLIVIMICACLIACAGDSATTPDAVGNEEDTIPYEEAASPTMSKFIKLHDRILEKTACTMSALRETNVLNEKIKVELEELDQAYDNLWGLYEETRSGMHPDVTVEEFLRMEAELEEGWTPDPVVLIDQDYYTWESVSPGRYSAPGFYTELGGWTYQFSARYANGTLELADGYEMVVEACENVVVTGDMLDIDSYRSCSIEDDCRDAWILLYGFESGYQLLWIPAD